MKLDYNNLNKVRMHNRNETFKHFIIKSAFAKAFFNEMFIVYTEHVIGKGAVCDVYACKNGHEIIIEIESKLTNRKINGIVKKYSDYWLKVVLVDDFDLETLETQVKQIVEGLI